MARLGRILIQIFADDHNPPHFHVTTPDHEALVLISDLSVLVGRIDRRSLDAARAWAAENRTLLEHEWTRLNRQ
ncbi:MAG: DUF4160 domain-containing protein [Rhizobiaceae bacterium]|nr:DUF4160 domain-containing protein [Rhizobiaceae bacterium]